MAENSNTAGAGSGTEGSGKTFTQDEVNAIVEGRNFEIPNNIAAGIFKKAQSGSTLAQLSGARPQKFGTQTTWILTAAPKAEIVGEGAEKSPTPATYAPKTIKLPRYLFLQWIPLYTKQISLLVTA